MAITEVGSGSQRAQITFVSANSQTLAYPANVTAGNLLICAGRAFNGTAAATAVSVTDTLGTSYTVDFVTEGANDCHWIAYGIAPSSGANTVTVNPNNATDDFGFVIDEFTGVISSPFSVDGGTSTGTSTAASDSITTLTDGELIIGIMGHFGASPTITSSQTQIGENENNSTAEAFAVAFQVAGVAGSYSMDWTIGTSVNWTASTISFKETASVIIDTSPKIKKTKRARKRNQSTDFTGFGLFSSVLSAAGLFDKDLITVAAAAGNTGSISSLLNNDLSSITGSQPPSGNTGDIASRANNDTSSLTGTQLATGTISSRANTDRSQATGTQTAGGAITSRANNDRSQLTGTQTATGTITSRAINDVSQLTGIQTASGSISSLAKADLSSLTGTQPASGSINSLLNADSSVVTGTHGNTVNGAISSAANADLSSLAGIQSASGAITSRAKDDTSQLTGIQSASGTITSRLTNDRSALSGSQPASGVITSLLNNDLSSLFGSQGGAVSGFITSRLNDDLSALFGGLTVETPLGGGTYYYRQRHEPLRVQKSAKKHSIDDNNPELLQENEVNLRSESRQAKARAVKRAQKRLFDAEQAMIKAQYDLDEANIRLIDYLEAQEAEIDEENIIIRIMAELL